MEVRDNRIHFEGISAESLLEKYGSPLYVYERKTIEEKAETLLNSIDYEPKELKYACKANTNIEIMKIIRGKGIKIDAVSPGEIYAALLAGFKPEDIMLSINNPSWDEIEYAVEKGVLINLDSLSALERYGKSYSGTKLCVRINPNVGAGHHNHVITGGPESKFGISYRDVTDIIELASKYNLKIVGIHQHIGSGILNPDIFIKAMRVLLDVAVNFKNLEFIDFGGGIGVPYRKEESPIDIQVLGNRITAEFESFCNKYGRDLKLVLEPGRYFVAESGFLLATVTSVKKGEKHVFIGTDTGFNHLIRPAMYGSYHEIYNASNVNGEKIPQVIAGNICESGDTFTRDENGIVDRELPAFKEGDIVCIANAGAYGYSMSSFYNSRPRPAEVLIENGTARPIRKRDTFEDIFKSNLDL